MTVQPAQPRDTVQLTLDDSRVFAGPIGTPLAEFADAATAGEPHPATIALIVNGKLSELSRPLQHDARASLVRLDSPDGSRIYRRSLSFLLVAVAARDFPEARVYIEHAITDGGYFCLVEGRDPFSPEELAELEAHMCEVVAANLPIERTEMPLADAVVIFQASNDHEKVALLEQRRKPTLVVYGLLGTRDYFHGFMAPSTGYLPFFALEWIDGGFLLRFPQQNTPTVLAPTHDPHSRLFEVFTEYSEWLQTLGIRNVSGLNDAIESDRLTELILVTEALHEQRISQIADQIANRSDPARLVLIAGPSSSGKTTFARRLAVRLLALGLQPLAISVDDYFVDRAHTPRDENGDFDFESLHTVDLALLNQQINQLIAGDSVTLPRFDFQHGQRTAGPTVQISPRHLLVLEGIHALNPALLPEVDPRMCFRTYASALTQLNLDRYNRISTTDTRLLRRIVRDARTRGYDAAATIARWESVRRGERTWIFPFQDQADAMFNSALTYELSVLKPIVEPLLLQIPPGTPERIEADRLLAMLQWFLPVGIDLIPSDSILREFIGGSILEHYRPWSA